MTTNPIPALPEFFPQALPELNLLIAFGVLLAFGTLGGILAARLRWVPTITGFMLLGLLIGPSGIGLLSRTDLASARVLVDIALGLILFRLGASLHPWTMARNRGLMLTSLAESGLTFGAILALMWWAGTDPMIAAIAAAIAVSSSPAVLIHVADELRARGPATEAAKSLVAMNNIFAFVLFSFSLPLALRSVNVELTTALLVPTYQLFGAVVVALVVAWVVTRIALQTRVSEQHFRFALVVGAVMLGLGLAVALKVSTLFTALSLGVACRWLQGRSRLTAVEFGGGGDVFFIILFAFAGATMHLDDLWQYGGVAVAFVVVRSLVKCLSIYGCGRAFGYSQKQSLGVGLMLVPMAGLAIGLVHTTGSMLPEVGAQITAIVFAAVAILETIGPPLVAFALRLTGEAHDPARQNVPARPPVAATEQPAPALAAVDEK
ncbi:cation:proton antiporter [Piscinibacter sakaiensis]|uniref:cation:proton antiporter n=1 Tax=Piscinibacter sakaiensis TaxID=1547922 RepID=UPI003AAD5EDA